MLTGKNKELTKLKSVNTENSIENSAKISELEEQM